MLTATGGCGAGAFGVDGSDAFDVAVSGVFAGDVGVAEGGVLGGSGALPLPPGVKGMSTYRGEGDFS